MERSKVLLWVLVFAAAGVIVWRVGFHTPESDVSITTQTAGVTPPSAVVSDPNEPADEAGDQSRDPNAPVDANEPDDPNKPTVDGEPNQPSEAERPASDGQVESGAAPEGEPQPAEPNVPSEPNEPLEAVNLKDVEMKNIIDKIATWTGKTVIPADEVMKQKITIYAPEKLPRIKALSKIYSALRMKGFIAEEVDDTIFLKPIKEAKLGVVPTVGADEPLAMFENRDQIVRKVFKLDNYAAARMSEVVQPLVGEYGYVGADETTGTLVVIDTVANLMSIEHIIAQFDVPEAGMIVEEFFEIKYGDPAEIIQLVRMLLGETPSGGSRSRNTSQVRRQQGRSGPSQAGQQGNASAVVIGASDIPPLLIAVPKRKWIIARGSAEDIKQIREWIEKLDREDPVRSEYETVNVRYANAREVAMRIDDALSNMPGAEGLRPSIMVRPLEQSRQIMIIGRADLREMVKGLIAEIDMPAGTFETKFFDLKHADPEQIKSNIESLYSEDIPGANYSSSAIYYYYAMGRGRNAGGADTVKVIAFPTMKQVTVIASPENMRRIEKQIEEWDTPLDVDAVKPRIIELHNSDPVQMVKLLTRLFSEEQDGSSNILRLILYGDMGDQRRKIVGPLYGQLTFEEVPGAKKIIVISKVPAAYAVIEQLIRELDRQDMAEVPRVVQLKYADPEDLSERLNAIFNEPGTAAPIRRSASGLREYSTDQSQGNQQRPPSDNNSNNRDGGNAGEYTSPWSRGGARARTDEEPISNVIGRVRFVPDPRSKSIMILAPPEFQDSIAATIQELDVPGKQVMIKAIIMSVDHEDMTSLGLQLASDAAAFGTLEENAVTALNELTAFEERGSFTFTSASDITALVDFLMKKTNAKILNQQSLWTEDNEEAHFFKGQEVAFQTSTSIGSSGDRVTSSFDYKEVGMTLQARPSITPERRVDMLVHVKLSQLTGDIINSQPVQTQMRTTTNMIVDDGETIMLAGVLFQQDSVIKRKIVLLGDLPLVGGLFRHNESIQANNELIVFLTPYVIDDGMELSPKAAEQIGQSTRKLEEARRHLEEVAERLKERLEPKEE